MSAPDEPSAVPAPLSDPIGGLRECSRILSEVRGVRDRLASVKYLTRCFDHILLTLPVRLSHTFFASLLRKRPRPPKPKSITLKIRKARRWLRHELPEVIPEPLLSSLEGVAERMTTVRMSYCGDYGSEDAAWQDAFDFGRHWDTRALFQREFRACVERFVESTTAAAAISKHFGKSSGPTITHGIRMSAWARVEVYEWRNQLKIRDLEKKMKMVSDITQRAVPAVERWETINQGVLDLTDSVHSNSESLKKMQESLGENGLSIVSASEFRELSARVSRTEQQLKSNYDAMQSLNSTFAGIREELSFVSKFVRLKQAEEQRRREDEIARQDAEAARLQSLKDAREEQLAQQKIEAEQRRREVQEQRQREAEEREARYIGPPQLKRIGKSRSGPRLLGSTPQSRSRSNSLVGVPGRRKIPHSASARGRLVASPRMTPLASAPRSPRTPPPPPAVASAVPVRMRSNPSDRKTRPHRHSTWSGRRFQEHWNGKRKALFNGGGGGGPGKKKVPSQGAPT